MILKGWLVATRADVARLAGVSTSTVSYALSGTRPISAQTRQRIQAAMDELGYTPHALAAGLAGRRSRILALLIPTERRNVSGPDLEYVVAAADAARERGYHVVLWPTNHGDLEDVRRLSSSGLVDGVLLMEVLLDDERVRLLQSSGVPVALVGRTRQVDDVVFADADFDQISRLSVGHLAGLGHRHLGLITAPRSFLDLGYGPSVRTAEGLTQAAAQAGVELLALPGDSTVTAGRAILAQLLERMPTLTAVISAYNWEATVGLVQEANARRLHIPHHLSVLLLSSSPAQADVTLPTLTTVGPSATGIGRAAVIGLINRIERPHAPPDQTLIHAEFAQRGSTGLAPTTTPPPTA